MHWWVVSTRALHSVPPPLQPRPPPETRGRGARRERHLVSPGIRATPGTCGGPSDNQHVGVCECRLVQGAEGEGCSDAGKQTWGGAGATGGQEMGVFTARPQPCYPGQTATLRERRGCL